MHGLPTNAINQHGQLSVSGIARTAANQMALGLGGSSTDVVSTQGIVGVPQLGEELWVISAGYDGNKHSWWQADVSNPTNIIVMLGGRRGTIDTDGSGSGGGINDQPAYDYNGASHEPGTIMRIRRDSVLHWGIIGVSAEGGSGSGSGAGIHTWHFDCDTGVLTQLR